MPLTGRPDDRAIAQCLADWGLAPEPLAADRPPASKHATVICRNALGERVLVKIAAEGNQPGLLREGAALLALGEAATGSPLAVPEVYAFDRALGVLGTRWIEGAVTLFARQRASGRLPLPTARALGRALGWLHARGRALAVEGDVTAGPDVLLALFRYLTPAAYARLAPAGEEFYAALQANTDAMAALQALGRDVPPALLHGDTKPANWVHAPGRGWVALDWELVDWGDPARDLGMLWAQPVQCWLAPAYAGEALERSAVTAFLASSLASYRRERSRQGHPAEKTFVLRAVAWTGAALLHEIYGQTHFHATFDARARHLMAHALGFLAHPHRWAWELLEAAP